MTYPIHIVGKYDTHTGIGQHSRAFINTLLPEFVLNFIDTRPLESELNTLPNQVTTYPYQKKQMLDGRGIAIFTDVLSNGSFDENYLKVPISTIKFAYAVLDSTLIPKEWIEIIEKHFDGVLVPSSHLIEVFQRSGVTKPVFCLPLAIDIQDQLAQIPRRGQASPFTFVAAGLMERRKNFHILLEAFEQAFGLDNPQVKLKLKLSGCLDNDYFEKYFQEIDKYKNTNIEINFEKMSKIAYQNYMRSSDCYISLSGGEGYSIIPREFLAAGQHVLLTEIAAHNELCDEKCTTFLPCTIPVPAYYPQIHRNNPYIGLQHQPYISDVVAALKKVFSQADKLYVEEKILKRKALASEFSYQALAEKYKMLIQPKMVEFGNKNMIDKDKLITNSRALLERYQSLGIPCLLEEKTFNVNKMNSPKKVVVMANDGGFFSIFNRMISYLVWELDENPHAIVLPDWRVAPLVKKFGRLMSFCYGKLEDGNIWLKLFEPLPYATIDEKIYNSELELHRNAILAIDYNENREPLLTYIHAYQLYKRPDFSEWRQWYHTYYQKYIKVKAHVQSKVDDFVSKHFSGKVVIAAHIRHPSHAIEQPTGKVPTNEYFLEKIKEIINQQQLNSDQFVVFIATDQEPVILFFKQHFSENLTYIQDAVRSTLEDEVNFKQLSKREQNKEGHQIAHQIAAQPERWNIKNAEDVIVDAMLLAKSNYFIHVTSNIATAVSFMNPQTRMIYCE